MKGLADFSISTNTVGDAVVVVNGEDVSDRVAGVSFHSRPGEVPSVSLLTRLGVAQIEGTGVVRVLVEEESGDDRQVLLAFLSSVEPAWLDKEVLGRAGWGKGSTMQIALEILKEKASG